MIKEVIATDNTIEESAAMDESMEGEVMISFTTPDSETSAIGPQSRCETGEKEGGGLLGFWSGIKDWWGWTKSYCSLGRLTERNGRPSELSSKTTTERMALPGTGQNSNRYNAEDSSMSRP